MCRVAALPDASIAILGLALLRGENPYAEGVWRYDGKDVTR
jgi:hypothetical protein